MTMLGSQWLASPAAAAFDTTLIGNSVWLDGSADCLTKTFGSGAAQSRLIISAWVQKNSNGSYQAIYTSVGGSAASRANRLKFNSDDVLEIHLESAAASTTVYKTTAKYRDTAWYHVLLSIDGNESDSVHVYVNGILQSLTITTGSAFTGTLGSFAHSGALQMIGKYNNTVDNFYFLKGYLTQTVMLVGKSIQAGTVAVTDFLDTQTFGDNGSQKIPKADADIAALASTAGGNSFCLDFAASGDLGNDISSNNQDWTPASMAAANQSVNTPSLTYPTFNQLTNTASVTFLAGNTQISDLTGKSALTTQGIPDGSWYWETKYSGGTLTGQVAGIATFDWNTDAELGYNSPASPAIADQRGIYVSNGNIGSGQSSGGAATSYGSGQGTDTYTGIAVIKSGTSWKIWFSESGTYPNSGDPAADTNPAFTWTSIYDYNPAVGNWSSNNQTIDLVMVAADWQGTAPTDFLSLASSNLTAPSYQGIDYFNPVLYAGNGTAIGSGGLAVTGVGFQPDWVWIKNRDAADSHGLYDAVRGTTKQIESDTNAAETTESEGLTTFGSDGFTVGSLAQLNTSSENYVAWQWLGGNATSTNDTGSIDSVISVADAGHFSIVTWEGSGANATVGHGMSGAPTMVLTMDRDVSVNWLAWQDGLTSAQYFMNLNTTGAEFDNGSSGYYRGTAPSSTVITMNGSSYNTSGSSLVAYCFRSVAGVCKVGSYTGNNSSDGVYLSLGFKPRWLLVKNVDVAGQDWRIYDTVIDPINENGQFFKANTNSAEITSTGFDFLADGLKARDSNSGFNSAATFIYLAMADIAGGGTLPPIYGR